MNPAQFEVNEETREEEGANSFHSVKANEGFSIASWRETNGRGPKLIDLRTEEARDDDERDEREEGPAIRVGGIEIAWTPRDRVEAREMIEAVLRREVEVRLVG